MTSNTQLDGAQLYARQLKQKNINAPFIICDGLQTPDNLGSILRVADAIGSRGIILLDNTIDLKHKKITKLSRSANQQVPIETLSFNEFRQRHNDFKNLFALEITSQSKDVFSADIAACDALLIGHESTGISEKALALCNGSFHLPMFGVNGSMNISHALAVFVYEWRRQHQY